MGRGTYVRDVADNFRNLKRDGLALGDDGLHRTCTNDVPKCRLGTLN